MVPTAADRSVLDAGGPPFRDGAGSCYERPRSTSGPVGSVVGTGCAGGRCDEDPAFVGGFVVAARGSACTSFISLVKMRSDCPRLRAADGSLFEPNSTTRTRITIAQCHGLISPICLPLIISAAGRRSRPSQVNRCAGYKRLRTVRG